MKALALALLFPSAVAAAPHIPMGPARAAAAQKAAEVRKLAPEENPRLGGLAKAFAKARVHIDSPAEREALPPGDVTVRLAISGYSLVGGAHAHLIVDNEPALQVDDASQPLTLKGVTPGPHLLRVVLCRPWHEVVKAPHAFAMVRFWSGPRTPGRAGAVAEQQVWPAPRRPLLTYVLPLGEPRADGPHLDGAAPATPAQASAPTTPTTFTAINTDPNLGGSDSVAEPPPPAPRTPPVAPPPSQPARRPRPPTLDFYLSGAKLGRRSYKVRAVLDRAELQLVKAWEPRRLPRLRPGRHHIVIDLLDPRALDVRGPLNRTARTFHTP